MKLSSLNTANLNGRLSAVALLSMFCVGGALVALSVVQTHPELPSKPYPLQGHVDASEEQEFLIRRAGSSKEPETIVTPKAVYTRYQVGERYYFFWEGQMVASGTEALPKLPQPSTQAAR